MNDIMISRIPNVTIAGDVAPDLITALGPQGDQFKLNVPEGHVARLWDFAVFCQLNNTNRYAFNLVKSPTPRDGDVAWTNDNEVNRGGDAIAALSLVDLFTTSGSITQMWPHTEHLWDLDYRLVLNPHVVGFFQGTAGCSFRLRYKLMRASRDEVASVLFFQRSGVKVE